ncbi:MAG: PEP-CTERM sorting domain-containing protein [Lacunisphaera sp.]|nr:PEP-CTERM sorting domain-containing protein [Lacunisphaera sp.]
MKSLFRLGLIGFLVALAPFARGQFSVSDDFSTLSGNWFNEITTGTGAFSVSVPGTEVLSYLDGGLTSATTTGSRDWKNNTGSYTQNWQVQVDFTFNFTQANSQSSSWSLYVGNLADITDNIQGMFQLSTTNLGVASRNIVGLYNTNGSPASPPAPEQIWDVASSTVTLQAIYIAATHTLSLAYDPNGSVGGYSFTPITSAAVDGSVGGLGWGMTNSDSFGFRLAASNSAGSTGTSSLTADQMFADNFAASSAIPEPSTYAAIFGALALLAAGWRRRQG